MSLTTTWTGIALWIASERTSKATWTWTYRGGGEGRGWKAYRGMSSVALDVGWDWTPLGKIAEQYYIHDITALLSRRNARQCDNNKEWETIPQCDPQVCSANLLPALCHSGCNNVLEQLNRPSSLTNPALSSYSAV